MKVMAASRYPAKSRYSFTAQFRSFRSLSFTGPNAEILTSRLSCWLNPSFVEASGRGPVSSSPKRCYNIYSIESKWNLYYLKRLNMFRILPNTSNPFVVRCLSSHFVALCCGRMGQAQQIHRTHLTFISPLPLVRRSAPPPPPPDPAVTWTRRPSPPPPRGSSLYRTDLVITTSPSMSMSPTTRLRDMEAHLPS
jgi:hypothetical protein